MEPPSSVGVPHRTGRARRYRRAGHGDGQFTPDFFAIREWTIGHGHAQTQVNGILRQQDGELDDFTVHNLADLAATQEKRRWPPRRGW